MRVVCSKCKKDFQITTPVALAYSLNSEKVICSSCSFKSVQDVLIDDFDIDIYDSNGSVKSLQNIIEELSDKWNN